jgi:hypothetical protein
MMRKHVIPRRKNDGEQGELARYFSLVSWSWMELFSAVEEAGYVAQFSDAKEQFKKGVSIKKGMVVATKIIDFAASFC